MLLSKADTPPPGDYLHQLKLDGFRCLLHSNGQVRLITRHGNECTAQFPELSLVLPPGTVLDGEMVVLQDGKPCFDSVMDRFRARGERKVQQLAATMPAHYAAFDLLYLKGEDLTKRPLEERLALLEQVVPKTDVISKVESFVDGAALFQAVKRMGLEGIVSKRKGSRYTKDARSRDWVKVKNYLYDTVTISALRKQEFGWSLSKDGNYVGICEFVPPTERKALHDIAKSIVLSEDKDWVYLKPLIKCQVKFQCWTRRGLMRTPSFVAFDFQGQ